MKSEGWLAAVGAGSILAVTSFPSAALATPLVGITSLLLAGNTEVDTFNATSIPFSQSLTETPGGVDQSGDSASYSAGNVGLSGNASSFSPSGANQNSAGFQIYYDDTFYIGGTGLQTFGYTLTLNGTDQGGDPLAYGYVGLYMNSTLASWSNVVPDSNCTGAGPSVPGGDGCGLLNSVALTGPANPGGSISSEFVVEGGTSVELGLSLSGGAVTTGNNVGDPSESASYVSTGFFTLSPVTAGASFTTASGLTYSDQPTSAEVPEPASIVMLTMGLAALGAVRRRKTALAD